MNEVENPAPDLYMTIGDCRFCLRQKIWIVRVAGLCDFCYIKNGVQI